MNKYVIAAIVVSLILGIVLSTLAGLLWSDHSNGVRYTLLGFGIGFLVLGCVLFSIYTPPTTWFGRRRYYPGQPGYYPGQPGYYPPAPIAPVIVVEEKSHHHHHHDKHHHHHRDQPSNPFPPPPVIEPMF